MSRSPSYAGSSFSDDLFMELTYLPEIAELPTITHQKLHVATSILQVTVFSTARPIVTWTRMCGNGRETIGAGMRRFKIDSVRTADNTYECSLLIEKPLQNLDSGFYVCKVRNDGGYIEVDFEYDYSEIEKFKPKSTSDPSTWWIKNENGKTDMQFELDFHSNYGPVEVTWDPPSWLRITDPAFKTATIDEGNGNYKAQMTVINFSKKEHDGYYRCTVQNDAGEHSHCFNPKFAESIS